jgi:hypothetical protein
VDADRSEREFDIQRRKTRSRRWRSMPTGRDELAAWRISTGVDVEDALRAGERLLAQAEERHRHGQNVTIGLYSIMVGTGLSFVASIVISFRVLSFGYGNAEATVAIVTAAATLAILLATARALFIQRQRMYTDYTLRIATELAAIVDEVLVEVAERERWSHLRIETTKLRLSVFPVYRPTREGHGGR